VLLKLSCLLSVHALRFLALTSVCRFAIWPSVDAKNTPTPSRVAHIGWYTSTDQIYRRPGTDDGINLACNDKAVHSFACHKLRKTEQRIEELSCVGW
jgi:hypothetical protein